MGARTNPSRTNPTRELLSPGTIRLGRAGYPVRLGTDGRWRRVHTGHDSRPDSTTGKRAGRAAIAASLLTPTAAAATATLSTPSQSTLSHLPTLSTICSRDGRNSPFAAQDVDREYEAAHGVRLASAYRHIIGPTPKCTPGDTRTARWFLSLIRAAINRGMWTGPERTRLYAMKRKWELRASGHDHRFNIIGNKLGGLSRQDQSLVDRARIQSRIRRTLERRAR